MGQPSSPAGWLLRLFGQRRAAAAPYHGLLIFVGQILLVLLVPLIDHGEHSTPLPLALAAVAMALASLTLLGYRALPSVLGVVAADLEGGRAPRWVDFLWLSFSTLTTAGFGDVSPVGTWPCAVASLEGLCGILYPATLIARIASLPAAGESGKCW